MTSEIICVGTELLTGDTVNTNASYLSRQLMALGAAPLYQSVVGDNVSRLTAEIDTALRRSEVIIITGGLGPTEDDLTKETAASLLKLSMYYDDICLGDITSYFAKKGRTMPEMNKKQALIPKGAVILRNDIGTAPGVLFDFEKYLALGKVYSEYKAKYLVLLPGPPREVKYLWEQRALPYLYEAFDGEMRLVSHYVTVFGKGESPAAEVLGSLLDGSNPTVSPYVKNGSVTFRVTASATSVEAAEKLTAPAVDEIKEKLGEYLVGVDIASLADVAVGLLKEKGLKVATAESCTGGYIAKKITDIAGSSEVFEYGAVTYSNSIKNRIIGIEESVLDEFGAVSEQVAMQMAYGVAQKCGADIAVSVTGLAGPGGGTEELPVGTVWIGIYDRKCGRTTAEKYLFGHGRQNERDWIRELASETALWKIIKTVRENYND